MPSHIFGDQAEFVWSGMEATLESFEGEAVVGWLPVIVEIGVKEVEDEMYDGQRKAKLANGREMKLPAFVKAGDVICLNTKEGGRFVKRLGAS